MRNREGDFFVRVESKSAAARWRALWAWLLAPSGDVDERRADEEEENRARGPQEQGPETRNRGGDGDAE